LVTTSPYSVIRKSLKKTSHCLTWLFLMLYPDTGNHLCYVKVNEHTFFMRYRLLPFSLISKEVAFKNKMKISKTAVVQTP